MTAPLYELKNVSHSFQNDTQALDGLNTRIETGECLALLGCNGAGKSTLLHILGGLISAREGIVLWHGQEISVQLLSRNSAIRNNFRRSVGTVFQDPDSQWLCDTVKDEVLYGPLQIWDVEEAQVRVSQVMDIMGINHLAEQAPYTLSGGQKRRVALASIISMDPEVLLLDEPTSSLDAATTDFLIDWLQEYVKRPGKTLIIATHDLELVRELTTRCVVMTPCHKMAREAATADVLADENLLRQMNLLRRPKTCDVGATENFSTKTHRYQRAQKQKLQ